MWNKFDFYSGPGMHAPFGMFWLIPIFFILIPVVFALKGYTLWNSAKRGELWWFIALFIINTFGILELVYIIFVLKKFSKPKEETQNKDHDQIA